MRLSFRGGRRRIGVSVVLTAVLSALLTPVGGGTAHAQACNPSGGFGADPYNVAGSTVGYGLIAYVDMPGCTTGVVDLVATAVPGTPGTCTLILPMIPGVTDGAGCGITFAPSGVATANSNMVIVAAGFAAGTSGVVPLIGTCSGRLGSTFPGPRCSLS